ncbi:MULTISPECIES: MBL fold metallo-hydrolase [Nocardioides]|uniref:Glyoxylase-like metal-dependent hydrolase (Beta-lactamase superfamily II) n=1 Tax=Nocardioides soli TaxID=1036020 RepID=A0A7W4VVV2_9ACTN|nr:MBL fold metallo-hydrolase [Nocardioides sp. LMS-CY]MBB3042713.1 glyoxylase-like metal-dependent hydrolase (beta-lactamase superfamily II) [Nocardioides soli]
MSTSSTSTAHAISPDSGEHWSKEGAWRVAEGIHRIPLPLPMDGLKAVNVYVLETADGLTLIDGGWAIEVARDLLERCLRDVGYGFGDIKRFLVTHIHRDHYTMAAVLGKEYGAEVALGADEKPGLDLLNDLESLTESPFTQPLVSAGARDLAELWNQGPDEFDLPDPAWWAYPDTWLEGDLQISVGPRTLDAVHTPGHTPGHYVFADQAAGLLFAGDHVLPTITPSIGFTTPPVPQPLGDFLASLTKVRGLPDLTILPAHGPVAPSSHARVDELLAHHDHRLDQSLAALDSGPSTSQEVARRLGWTRHEKAYDELDEFSRGMAAMETKAHLELLAARGRVTRTETPDGVVFTAVTG